MIFPSAKGQLKMADDFHQTARRCSWEIRYGRIATFNLANPTELLNYKTYIFPIFTYNFFDSAICLIKKKSAEQRSPALVDESCCNNQTS